MIVIGDRVDLDLKNEGCKSLVELLNYLGGQVVKCMELRNGTKFYLVAIDEQHLDEIERARHRDNKPTFPIETQILGTIHPKEFKDDKRYYVLAFEDEMTLD